MIIEVVGGFGLRVRGLIAEEVGWGEREDGHERRTSESDSEICGWSPEQREDGGS